MNNTNQDNRQTLKAVAERLFHEVINQRNFAVAGEIFAPDYSGNGARGPEGFVDSMRPLHKGFPDLRFTIEDVLVEGAKVAVRWTSKGTHRTAFAGAAPTGREVTNAGISIYRIADGKIVEAWSQIDRLGVLQQLGVVSTPAAKPATAPVEAPSAQ